MGPRGPEDPDSRPGEGAHPSSAARPEPAAPGCGPPEPPPPGRRARGGPHVPQGPALAGHGHGGGGRPPPPVSSAPPGPVGGMAWPRAGGDRGRREGGRQAGRGWPGRGGGCLAGRAGTGSQWAFSWGAARPTPRHGAWRRDCVTPPPLAGCRLEADRDSRRLGRPCPGMWAPRCLLGDPGSHFLPQLGDAGAADCWAPQLVPFCSPHTGPAGGSQEPLGWAC